MTKLVQGFIQLKRCDDQLKSINEMVDPVFLNNTTEIDMNNQIPEVKQNHRLTRKRTFQNKSVTEDCDQGDKVKKKKKKLMVKIVPQKVTKKLQNPISVPVKLTENISTNSDFNKISDTISSSIRVNNDSTYSIQSSLKTTQNERKNDVNSNEKNVLVNNVNEDYTSNEHGKNEKNVPLKTARNIRKKSTISYEKNVLVNNVNSDDTSNEHGKNDKNVPLKTARNIRKKSTISYEKNVLVNNVNSDDTSNEHGKNDKNVPLKTARNIRKKSTISYEKNVLVNNVNSDDTSNEHRENEKLLPINTARNIRKKSTISYDKNVLVNNVNEDNTSNEHGKNEKNVPLKTARNIRKKSTISYEKNVLVNNVNSDDTSNEHRENEKLLPIKTARNIRKKSTISYDKNVLVNNVNADDTSNEHRENEKLLPLKVPKSKIITSKKNVLVNYINKDDISNEHGKNKKLISLQIPESKTPKRRTYTKKKLVSKVGEDNIPNELAINDKSLESPKHNLFKSDITAAKSVVVNNTNKNDVTINFEENCDLPQTKSPRNKSKKVFDKKKPVIKNVKKINVHNEVGERSDIVVSQKRSFSSPKRGKLPNSDVGFSYNNKIDLKQTLSIGKPPKIKKKWSDEWSGNKLLDNILKSNDCDHLGSPKINLNNSTKAIKKVLKTPKSKNTKHNFVKNKILDKLSNNTNNSLLIKSPNTSVHMDTSTIDILGIQDPNYLFSTNNIPFTSSRDNNHDVVTEPILRLFVPHMPFVCEETKSIQTIQSEVSKKLTTPTQSTELPTISIEVPSISIPLTSTSIPSTSTSIPSTSTSIPSTFTSIPSTFTSIPSTFTSIPSTSIALPSTFTALSSTSTELPSTAPGLPTTCTGLPAMSTELPTKLLSISTMSNNVVSYENYQLPPDPIFNYNYSFPMGSESTEISYGITILSEAISRQSREAIEGSDKIKSSEQELNEIKSSSQKANSCFRSQVPISTSATASCQEIADRNNIPKISQENSRLYNLLVRNDENQSCLEPQLHLISKRYNIPVEDLRKTVVDEPLAVFHEKFCDKITPSMLTISPIVKDLETQPKNGRLGLKYKIDPIREAAAYEKTNLQDLMEELSNTMPSWSLSIVPNPSRYVITNMSTDKNGVPIANKVIVLDKSFTASVYINQSLEHSYCKPLTTATEIVNLIKDLNSI